jgi:uncharacterized protein (DUF486 family)
MERNGTTKLEGWRRGSAIARGGEWLPYITRSQTGVRVTLISRSMPVIVKTTLLLIASNCFMTFAWYAHLKNLHNKPLYIAILVSWGIALFEYALQVPANRIGSTQLELGQLKILQEVITLSVFVPFAALYMKEPVKLNYLWAALCMAGAVYFVFRR